MSGYGIILLSVLLFSGGVAGFFLRKDLLTMLLSAEVALSGGILALLYFSTSRPVEAQAAVIAILTVAAGEVAVALASVAVVVRIKGKATEKTVSEMKG